MLCNVQMRDVIRVKLLMLMLVAMVINTTADVTNNLRHRRSDVIHDGESLSSTCLMA